MPKAKQGIKTTSKTATKSTEKKVSAPAPIEEEKIIEIDLEDKLVDPELIPGEDSLDDPEDEEALLDDEEVDPFKDKWEE